MRAFKTEFILIEGITVSISDIINQKALIFTLKELKINYRFQNEELIVDLKVECISEMTMDFIVSSLYLFCKKFDVNINCKPDLG